MVLNNNDGTLPRDNISPPQFSSPSNTSSSELLPRPVLPGLEQTIDRPQSFHENGPTSHGPNGGTITSIAQPEPPMQWNSFDNPAATASQTLIVDHNYLNNKEGGSISYVPGDQMITNPFPTNIPTFTADAGMFVGYQNAWDPNNISLNNPQMMQPQGFSNNGLYSVDAYPPLDMAGNNHPPFGFEVPMASLMADNTHPPFGFEMPMVPLMAGNNSPLFGSKLPTALPLPAARTFCTLCPASFTRASDYPRHWDSMHLGIKHHCFYLGCGNNRGNGYCRAEKLKTHRQRVHGLP